MGTGCPHRGRNVTWGSTRWCDGIKPASVTVSCRRELHRITWRRGKLVLEDHNLTPELALTALGGDRCECLEVLRAWGRLDLLPPLSEDFISLMLEKPAGDELDPPLVGVEGPFELPDHPSCQLAIPGRMPASRAAAIRTQLEDEWLRHILMGLPSRLGFRMVLAAVMRMERRWTDIPADDRLSIQLYLYRIVRAAVITSMESWRRVDPILPYLIDCWLAFGERSSIEGRVDHERAEATVVVPLSWLVRVWSRGIAVVDGCFILDASGDLDDVAVQAVRWQRLTPFASEAITVSGRLLSTGEGAWTLRCE